MNVVRPSEVLDRKVDLVSGGLGQTLREFWSHPHVSELVPSYLFRMNCQSRAAVNLMETAIKQLKARAEDSLSRPLIDYLEYMIPEESGHDEWLLDGLELLGLSREDVLTRIPPPSAAAMMGAQYYWIHHHHPVALLGFIKVGENKPATHAQIERIIERTGIPKEIFKYFVLHADLEPHHNKFFDKTLDALPLTDEHNALIGVSAIFTVHQITNSVSEILKLHQAQHAGNAGEPLGIEQIRRRLRREGASSLL